MNYNVHEAKANLSKLLELVAKGEKVYICKRNIRLAELKPIHEPEQKKRPIGGLEGQVDMTHFFDPMSDEELAAWGYPMEPDSK